jgi:hypothetical protein
MDSLRALRSFSAARETPERKGLGLAKIGLEMPADLEFCRGSATPLKSEIFAHTGGDGVHFCLLEVADEIRDDSPVVMVVPANSEAPRLVVGDTLSEFLALGSVIGFFFLEQLVYDREETLGYLFDYDAFIRHVYEGGKILPEDEQDMQGQRQLLSELRQAFVLAPWPKPEARLLELSRKWRVSL